MDVSRWLGPWRLDPDRTDLAFHSPTFWGLAHVNGRFTRVEGSGLVTAPDLVSGRLKIDTASVHTGIGKRDTDLRSAGFFDVQAFPSIVVTVESAEVIGPGWVTLHTELSVKGNRRQLDLPTHVQGIGEGVARLTTTTTLNRRTFGVDGNLLGMMGDAVTIEATAVFIRQS